MIFIERPLEYADSDEFVAVVGDTSNKNELFEQLVGGLHIGNSIELNWDALIDYLTDLSWIEQEVVVLVHATLPKLELESLRTYLWILDYASKDWSEDPEHKLKVIFPRECEKEVMEIIADNPYSVDS